jgi:hypothetical protein
MPCLPAAESATALPYYAADAYCVIDQRSSTHPSTAPCIAHTATAFLQATYTCYNTLKEKDAPLAGAPNHPYQTPVLTAYSAPSQPSKTCATRCNAQPTHICLRRQHMINRLHTCTLLLLQCWYAAAGAAHRIQINHTHKQTSQLSRNNSNTATGAATGTRASCWQHICSATCSCLLSRTAAHYVI